MLKLAWFLGIPLMVEPGVLITLLISGQAYGYTATILYITLNLLIVCFVFGHSHRVMQVLKDGGTRGLGKGFAPLLAAFGMMMIRTGILGWMKVSEYLINR